MVLKAGGAPEEIAQVAVLPVRCSSADRLLRFAVTLLALDADAAVVGGGGGVPPYTGATGRNGGTGGISSIAALW